MRNLRMYMVVLGLVLSSSVYSQDEERYRYFRDDGIFDPRITNQMANEYVRSGIASREPKIVELTIGALARFSSATTDGLPNPHGGPIPSREFPDIPGLRRFLMDYFWERFEASGYDTRRALLESMGLTEGETLEDFDPTDVGLTDGEQDLDEVLTAVEERLPVWPAIPGTLCEFWPGDGDVHRFVWQYHEAGMSAHQSYSTLSLLNVGKFVTPEADAFRISQLGLLAEDDPYSLLTVQTAVEGLAFSRPTEALPHLIATALRNPSVRRNVLMAIAAYEDDVIGVHASDLSALLATGRPMLQGPAAAAFDRLESLADDAR